MSSALHQLNMRVQVLEDLCGNLIDTNKATQLRIQKNELDLATLLESHQ